MQLATRLSASTGPSSICFSASLTRSERWDCRPEFEIDDALRKLVALVLVEGVDEALVAVDLDRAIALLDRRWDEYFQAPAAAAESA